MIGFLKRLLFSSISIRLASVAIGFATSVFINRALGLELRGSYTTVFTYATLLQTCLNLGIAFAYVPLQKEIGVDRARAALVTLIWIQAVLCGAAAVLFLCSNYSIENLLICILMCAMIPNSQIVFLALIDDIRSRNQTLLISAVGYMVANIGILFLARGNLVLVIGCLAIKNIFEIVMCSRRQDLFLFSFSSITPSVLTGVARYGIPTAALAFLITANYNIDVVVLNVMGAGEDQLGIFGVAYSLSNMLWFVPDAFKEYVYNKSAKEVSAPQTLVLVFINMILCLVLCLAFMLVGRMFLEVFYGLDYGRAFGATLLLFFGIIPMVAFKLIHPIYVNKGRPLSVVCLLLTSIVANVICASWLVPHYGAVGAAWASVASYSLCGILFIVKFWREYRVKLSDVVNAACSLARELSCRDVNGDEREERR